MVVEDATMSGRMAFRIGAAVALATGFLETWMNLAVGIVGDTDNAQNQGFFGVIAAAAACAFVARLRSDGMARAMLATAGVQALLGLMVATAPITARVEPMGAAGVAILSSVFTALWLASAAMFRASARRGTSGLAA
jgi:hypothetical protein